MEILGLGQNDQSLLVGDLTIWLNKNDVKKFQLWKYFKFSKTNE